MCVEESGEGGGAGSDIIRYAFVFFFHLYFIYPTACTILAPQPGVEPAPSAV